VNLRCGNGGGQQFFNQPAAATIASAAITSLSAETANCHAATEATAAIAATENQGRHFWKPRSVSGVESFRAGEDMADSLGCVSELYDFPTPMIIPRRPRFGKDAGSTDPFGRSSPTIPAESGRRRLSRQRVFCLF